MTLVDVIRVCGSMDRSIGTVVLEFAVLRSLLQQKCVWSKQVGSTTAQLGTGQCIRLSGGHLADRLQPNLGADRGDGKTCIKLTLSEPLLVLLSLLSG